MNKKIVIAALAVLVIIVGSGASWYFLSRQPGSSPAAQPSETSESSVRTPVSPSLGSLRSLRSLLASGLAQKCTVTVNTDDHNSTGVVYINNGQVRADITSQINGQPTVTHMIVSDNTSYVWIGDEITGFKMSVNPDVTPSPQQQSNTTGLNPDEAADYQCSEWTPDSSVFDLPSSVKFTDFTSALVPSGSVVVPTGSTSPSADQCAACSYLTGQDKTQCLTSLNCTQ